MPATPKLSQRMAWRRRLVASMLIALAAGASAMLPAAAQPASAAAPVSVSTGGDASCAIEAGKAYCWGYNTGELGSDEEPSSVPVAVDTSGVLAGKALTQISVGEGFTCALDATGAAYCWGDNGSGQLGDGRATYSPVPVAVDTDGALAGRTLTRIAAGEDNACALDSTGAAYCWGNNSLGLLGNGSFTDSLVPVAVVSGGVLAGKTLTEIATYENASCALDSSGRAYCWGYNQYGGLGDGTDTSSNVPVAVSTSGALAGKSLRQISIGFYDVCGLGTSGVAYCWGADFGSVPVAVDTSGVLAGKTLTQVAVGGFHRCVLDTTGRAYCWGENSAGQLGDGGIDRSGVPVAVDTSGVLAGKTLTQISGGYEHTCAVDSTDALYCWGDNEGGDLGNNSSGKSVVPVLVGPSPAGPPSPTGVGAIPGDGSAAISWTAPSFAGTITGYTATASPGGQQCSTSGATSCTISGLTNQTTYSVTVVTHSADGDSVPSESASVTPTAGPPSGGLTFTSAASDQVGYGAAFSFTVTTSGSPVPKVIRSGRLPDGVQYTKDGNGTGTLAGTPAGSAAGAYPMTFTATNKSSTITQAFTLTVTRVPAVKKIPPQTVPVGSPVSVPVSATGYPVPAFTESGPLPAGVHLTDHGDGTATIAGTPGAGTGGSYPVTVTAASTSGTSSQSFTLAVDEAPAITSAAHATATTGTAFSFQINATGFPFPSFTHSGTLPKGLVFSGSAGTITGTPNAGTAGTYPITITARNSSGTTIQAFTLTVS